MLPGVHVLAGPARCGKTHRLLDDYRNLLAREPLGTTLWLSPTHRTATAIRQQIAGAALPGCMNPNCLTFGQLSRRLLEASPRPVRPIGLPHQRQILRHLIDAARAQGRLEHFGPIARTPGFLDVLVRFIREFKRLEIWPEELAVAVGRRAAAKDRELCQLYSEYQQLLNAHHLYDAQGQFWSARALLRDGAWGPFARVRYAIVDGFTDFTRTEHEILELLAGRVESLAISLPLEVDSARRDLFAKPAKTLAELRRRHGPIAVESLPRRSSPVPGMEHLERSLFANPRQIRPAPDATGIEILAAAEATGEIEQLARRIKRLLTGTAAPAVRPGDILVVFRSLADSAEVVREVFTQFGIPVALEAQRPLASAPLMSALVAWLRLDLEDWPFRQVLAVLVHNRFRPIGPGEQHVRAVMAAERQVRELQLPTGRAELIVQLERRAAGDKDPNGESPARTALTLIRQMSQALDELPRRATLNQWAEVLARMAAATGLLRDPDPPEAAADQKVWQQCIAALEASSLVSDWTGQPQPLLSRQQFFDHLQDILCSESLPGDHDETGRVRVLSAESARNVSASYVFLAGLSENAFPAPGRDDCLHSEAETRQLISAGLPLVPAAERSQHEMLLFYELVTRATGHLVLSYPALNAAAQPLSPSPFLSAVEQAFAAGHIPRNEQPDLSCVPPTDEVYGPRDFRVRAVRRALDGDTTMLAALSRHPTTRKAAEQLLCGLRASSERQRGSSFGAYEGMLVSEAAQRVLLARFGAEHCWSPSQLEQYARCPFQFFFERVLNLEPCNEPALAADFAGRGRMLHWLLSALHRTTNDRAQERSSPADGTPETLLADIQQLMAELLDRKRGSRALENGMLEIDARRVSQWLSRYHEQHMAYDAAARDRAVTMRPAHFEVSFGPRRQTAAGPRASDTCDAKESAEAGDADDVDPLSSLEPFELDCSGETIRFAGRIDRIDLGTVGGQAVFTIVDYKSSASDRTKAKAIAEGHALQLPLYAMAAEALLANHRAVPLSAAYWHVGGKGFQEAIQFHLDDEGQLAISPQWDSLRQQLRHRVRALVAGIRQGQFPMHSVEEDCTSRCAYGTVCRVNQVRALGKSWVAPSETSP